MSIEQFALYCIAIFAVSIIPGPSMALAFSEGTRGGVNSAVPAALGNVTASLGQGAIAYLTFRSIVTLEPKVLTTVQIIGAIYIAYIGLVFIRHSRRFRLEAITGNCDSPMVATRFQTGFLVAFFNPKAILFFVALFPQFVSGAADVTLGSMGAVFLPIGIIALFCFLTYGYLGQISLLIFDESKVSQWIIPGLGVCLLLTSILALIEAANQILQIQSGNI